MKRIERKETPRLKSIKVVYSRQLRKAKDGPYSRTFGVELPKIRMERKWLEEIGFHIGDRLKVEYFKGSIHISPMVDNSQLLMVCEPLEEYGVTDKNTQDKGKVV